MLRRIRIILATLFFTFITLLFLDFTGSLHAWFGWMAKVQFLPAVLALNVGIIVALLIITLVNSLRIMVGKNICFVFPFSVLCCSCVC